MQSAEYKALERVVKADKRYRRFIYILTFIFFALVLWDGYDVQQNIEHKIDSLVNGSIARAAARAADQKTIAREEMRYITCIFVIPIEQRTPETQEKCFEAADLPGGLTRSDFSPIVVPDVAPTSATPAQSSLRVSSASSNTTPVTVVTQPNSSQGKTNLLPPAHKPGIAMRSILAIRNLIRRIL
jgi:hypothetical protein